MFDYSEKVMEHFANPHNVGEIENPDGVGKVGNPVCGDLMTFYIKVVDGCLSEVKFKTFGCGAAIAVSSMVSEMAKGKTLSEAMTITNEMVAEELGGLPPNKLHCSNLGADALHKAVEDYQNKKVKQAKTKCHCPYCQGSITEESPFCQACGREFSGG
ncbi:Fe-S cluster assembly scaffold protein NifU [bacterium]|nr:Fe-S cluster assembly scaffold protein NifU [bacterium]MBU1599192.1 Fe-S cluster assembly scaffold protein NifU [bacterium]